MGYREKIIEVARQQLGVSEPLGDDKYIRWYNSVAHTSFDMDVSWCGIFVSWVMRMAEVPEDICPNFASCGTAIAWAKDNGIWKERSSGYIPSPADLVFFDWQNDGKQDHVGIVAETDNKKVYTIEGNTSNKVGEKPYSLSSTNIMGYIALNLGDICSESDTSKDAPVEEIIVHKEPIADIQKLMNQRYNSNLAVDNIWGAKSKKALVKAIQKQLNTSYRAWLMVDGIWGANTQKAWRNVRKGDSSNFVWFVQISLVVNGYDIEVDGIFGKETQKAVKDFQKKSTLAADGIVGPLTMSKLIK